LLRILTLLFSKLSIDVIIVRQLLVKIYIKFGSGFYPINTTAHEVRQRAKCNNCGVKGNNTYQIVYTGNSSSWRLRFLDMAMDGAEVGSD
ncbi:hypothetical protein N9I81_02395, partial [Planktomarina temperata]|nr:hypothetical protein [Planktomarina temperata]